MERIIIRSKIGDEEIRYHIKVTEQEYASFLRILKDNPGIDQMEAFKKSKSTETEF